MLDLKLSILDAARQKLLSRLAFLKTYDFYLAGGTAIALQIGHRTSIDFDFYTPKPFDPMMLWARFQKEVPASEMRRVAEGTLIVLAEGAVEMSFFFYDYPLLEPLAPGASLNIASLKDLAAMKVVAIAQRGLRRDFIDLYFLSKKIGLVPIIEAVLKKYKGYNVYTAFQALCYFEDAEQEPERYKLLQPVLWKEVKTFFQKEVKNAQKLF